MRGTMKHRVCGVCGVTERVTQRVLVLGVAMLVWEAWNTAWGATIVVPTDDPSIASAVAAAQVGDTVRVLPGMYEETTPFVFWRERVTLVGSGPDDTVVINAHPYPGMCDVRANDVVIRGMTLYSRPCGVYVRTLVSGARIEELDIAVLGPVPGIACGAALNTVVMGSSVRWGMIGIIAGNGAVVSGNTIRDCNSGGIRAGGTGVVISGNTIMHNNAYNTGPYGTGGGIDVPSGSDILIEGNTIEGNWVDGPSEWTIGYGRGGGVYIADASNVTVRGNRIVGNQGIRGAGLFIRDSSVILERNEIVANHDSCMVSGPVIEGWGAGVHLERVVGTMTGNTIARNLSTFGGGGVYVDDCPDLLLERNIIARNESGSGGGVFVASVDGAPSLLCNDVWGNFGGDYAGIADPTGQDGNFSLDPLFCSETEPDSVRSDSPCTAAQSPSGCGEIGAYGVGCWVTAGLPEAGHPRGFVAWPNPAGGRGGVRLEFGRTGTSRMGGVPTSLEIVTPSGRRVRTLSVVGSGAIWDGRDEGGLDAAPGVYFVRAKGPGQGDALKLVLLP